MTGSQSVNQPDPAARRPRRDRVYDPVKILDECLAMPVLHPGDLVHHELLATGGDGQYVWDADSLPFWLDIDPEMGDLDGTVATTAAPHTNMTIRVRDGHGGMDEADLPIRVVRNQRALAGAGSHGNANANDNNGRRNLWLPLTLTAAAVVLAVFLFGALLRSNRNWPFDTGTTIASAPATQTQTAATAVPATNTPGATSAPATQTPVPPAASPTPARPGLTPVGFTGSAIPAFGDIESMPRLSSTSAQLGAWYHPVYNDKLFKDSKGMDGQWNWTNTILQIAQTGGTFLQGPDGELWFQHTAQTATFAFAVKTTSKYKADFMPAGQFPIQVSLDAFHDGAVVHILDETGRDLNGGQPIHLSEQGQTAVTLPDDGITVVTVTETDPTAKYQFKARFGPDDRPANNHFDARNR